MPVSKVLVVDDSPTERHSLTEILTANGFQVETAQDGEEAVAKTKAVMPDLVLMDVVMPGLNGFQATRSITKDDATKHIPVIICSTKDQETDRVWGIRQGAKDYITKPVDKDELLTKIRAI
jgi:twitching motility two-component system response regulator PilH